VTICGWVLVSAIWKARIGVSSVGWGLGHAGPFVPVIAAACGQGQSRLAHPTVKAKSAA
jgi:hypothetical protein